MNKKSLLQAGREALSRFCETVVPGADEDRLSLHFCCELPPPVVEAIQLYLREEILRPLGLSMGGVSIEPLEKDERTIEGKSRCPKTFFRERNKITIAVHSRDNSLSPQFAANGLSSENDLLASFVAATLETALGPVKKRIDQERGWKPIEFSDAVAADKRCWAPEGRKRRSRRIFQPDEIFPD